MLDAAVSSTFLKALGELVRINCICLHILHYMTAACELKTPQAKCKACAETVWTDRRQTQTKLPQRQHAASRHPPFWNTCRHVSTAGISYHTCIKMHQACQLLQHSICIMVLSDCMGHAGDRLFCCVLVKLLRCLDLPRPYKTTTPQGNSASVLLAIAQEHSG